MFFWIALFSFLVVFISDSILFVKYIAAVTKEDGPYLEKNIESVSVIVPAYNAQDTISGTLDSILRSENVDFEVIVVDDGSQDATYNLSSKTSDKRVTTYHIPHQGKWAALNFGIAKSLKPIIVTIDADTLVLPDTLYKLSLALQDADAVAGNLQVASRETAISYVQAQEHIRIAMHRRAGRCVETISGPVAGFRKELLFKNEFRNNPVEDFEHTLRLRESGAKIIYAPEAKAYTIMPKKLHLYLMQRTRWAQGSIKEMKAKKSSFAGIYKGYFIAVCDIIVLPLCIVSRSYFLLLFLPTFEGIIQAIGSLKEKEEMFLSSLLFYPQLIFLAGAFLYTNFKAHFNM
ncbi:MAG: glycosyltransferase family 2 protein [Candidatus Methanofastidiosia archaeon]